jgi:hypothetical protein
LVDWEREKHADSTDALARMGRQWRTRVGYRDREKREMEGFPEHIMQVVEEVEKRRRLTK